MRWRASVVFRTSHALVNRLNPIMSGRTLTDVNRLGEHMFMRPVRRFHAFMLTSEPLDRRRKLPPTVFPFGLLVIRFKSYPISKELSMMYRPDQFLLTGRHKPF